MSPEKSSEGSTPFTKVPNHIAIIMDGNGRWAKARGLPRVAGHRAGTENLRRVIRSCVEFGVKVLTIYAFSTENWGRPEDEVSGLMRILEDVIDRELTEMHKEGVRLVHIGRLEKLSDNLRQKVIKAVELTQNNTHLTVCIAWNYGGRDEIVCAIRRMLSSGVKEEDVNEALVSSYLFTAGLPDPDLLIRTASEMRISNFLLWQAAYSELYVTPAYWPDFDKQELRKAILAYGQRDRRYGKLPEAAPPPCPEN
jgi:undecaprenyl diphosphate synthase